MENFLRSRIKSRLEALGLNQFDVARAAGLNRYIVSDLLSGKKETIRGKAVAGIAGALDCDPEFLMGAQEAPRRAASTKQAGISLSGVCEAGTWRRVKIAPGMDALPIAPDARYPADRQAGYLIRGEAAAGIGFHDGFVAVVLIGDHVRDGDFVVARRKRGAETELSVWRVVGDALTVGDDAPSVPMGQAEILGRVISAHRVL